MAYDEHEDIKSISFIFRMGVDGYLLKTSSMDQLATCIKNLLNGKRYMPAELFEMLIPSLIEIRRL